MTTKTTGEFAENIALEYIQAQGSKLCNRNFRCKNGEIDLIIQDVKELAFVEVRYRQQENFGSGAATVSRAKQRKIIKTAQYYLQQEKINYLTPCRFDVISITADNSDNSENAFKIDWIKDAFQ